MRILFEKLEKICKENNIVLIEDAAEALGSKYKGKLGGSFGNFSVHSFHRTKTITTGEGGMIVTNDKKIYQELHHNISNSSHRNFRNSFSLGIAVRLRFRSC